MKFQLVEPLRQLFKDEVREVGTESACRAKSSAASRSRPGLAVRVLGDITRRSCASCATPT